MAPPKPIVETVELTKKFGDVIALDRLELEMPSGSIGLLGPNGAGKTTLLRILLGLTRPITGGATVLGYDAATEGIEIRQRVGYMPETDCLPSNATAADFVGHMAEMSGLPKKEARQRAADVLYQVGLDEERYRLIKGFSTGMKQRVKLAQSIVHDPSLVFLDEPTAGLDPQGREGMLELVERIHTMMGMTVVLSSHILEDIERVCDHVVIINGGKLVLSQPIGANRPDGGELQVSIDGEAGPFIAKLAEFGVSEVRLRNGSLRAGVAELIVGRDDDEVYDAIRDAAAALDLPLRSLRSRTKSLEDVYLQAVAAGDLAIESSSSGESNG